MHNSQVCCDSLPMGARFFTALRYQGTRFQRKTLWYAIDSVLLLVSSKSNYKARLVVPQVKLWWIYHSQPPSFSWWSSNGIRTVTLCQAHTHWCHDWIRDAPQWKKRTLCISNTSENLMQTLRVLLSQRCIYLSPPASQDWQCPSSYCHPVIWHPIHLSYQPSRFLIYYKVSLLICSQDDRINLKPKLKE